MILHLLLAGADCAQAYQHHLLDHVDARRCQQQATLAQRTDWRSSRFLKQQLDIGSGHAYSLSHSHGHAALAYANNGSRMGVDIEYMRRRDFAALLTHCATAEEIDWWRQQSDPCMAFYALWTLKEALIKAANLDFPAALQHVGLFRHPQNSWQAGIANATSVVFWSGFTQRICAEAMLACVWPTMSSPPQIHWQGFGHTDWYLPPTSAVPAPWFNANV